MENVNIIRNFISEDECKLIINKFSNAIWDAKDPFIKTGFAIDENSAVEYFFSESKDFLHQIFKKIAIKLSFHYKKQMELKSMFHSIMTPGALNPLHWDNYVENGEDDISALLYLNKEFKGGDLYFPDQDIRITPEPGMLVFFEGKEDYHHTVEIVTEGNREALVGFYWPTSKRRSIRP